MHSHTQQHMQWTCFGVDKHSHTLIPLQVMSTPDFDFGSSCYLFTDCLQQIANWSAANPNHFPVSVFIHKGSSTPPQTTLGNAYGPALQQLQVEACLPVAGP